MFENYLIFEKIIEAVLSFRKKTQTIFNQIRHIIVGDFAIFKNF